MTLPLNPRSAAVWKYFILKNETINGGGVHQKRSFICGRENCHQPCSDHPKNAYRHIRLCKFTSLEEKSDIIASLPSEETEKYKKHWYPDYSDSDGIPFICKKRQGVSPYSIIDINNSNPNELDQLDSKYYNEPRGSTDSGIYPKIKKQKIVKDFTIHEIMSMSEETLQGFDKAQIFSILLVLKNAFKQTYLSSNVMLIRTETLENVNEPIV